MLGPQTLGYVAKRVHGCVANTFFVGFQEVKQFEADVHPFTSRNKFGVLRMLINKVIE
jgi:hypothetical protein